MTAPPSSKSTSFIFFFNFPFQIRASWFMSIALFSSHFFANSFASLQFINRFNAQRLGYDSETRTKGNIFVQIFTENELIYCSKWFRLISFSLLLEWIITCWSLVRCQSQRLFSRRERAYYARERVYVAQRHNFISSDKENGRMFNSPAYQHQDVWKQGSEERKQRKGEQRRVDQKGMSEIRKTFARGTVGWGEIIVEYM